MGRSTASCFKILTCGSDGAGKDDVEASESKGSSDKRGWSFRKRSARHRVLSNTVVSEMPSSSNKESPETAAFSLQIPPNPTVPEKASAMPLADGRTQLSTLMNLEGSDAIVATEDATMHDADPDESVIVVIQTAIRGFLARREMPKLKKVVKLQAVVRGHLVRRQAVGTLRCVQAIVKMQALVRARRARVSSEVSCIEMELDGNDVKDDQCSKLLEKGNSAAKPIVMYTSIEKLLSNKFACQLMESTPRTKRIHIKCDPSRSDSAWNWLERWMTVSSVGTEQPQKPELRMEQPEKDNVNCSACQVETGFPSEGCESTDLKADIRETEAHSKRKENLDGNGANDFDFQACQPSLSDQSDNPERPQPENSGATKPKESSLDFPPYQTKPPEHPESVTSGPEMESGQSIHSVKRFAPEQVKTEGKEANPAFITTQSKFEELTSTTNSARSTGSYSQDGGVELNSDTISSGMENAIKTREIGPAENSDLHTSIDKVGGSDCGTELSISSTLDSPDRPEIEVINIEQEVKLSEEGTSNSNSTKNVDIEANDNTTIQGSDLSYPISVQPEKLDTINATNGESVVPVTVVDSLQEKEWEMSESNGQTNLDLETGHHQPYKSSPEASPRSHITIPGSQGTPSSQVSVNTKRTKSDKGASNHKRKSLSADKRSPSNPNKDPTMGSLEQLPKDHQVAKRRNSFGSGRPDHVDQEPRDSNSSNSLPSYMQATESARAKALANSSPRSSPDMQDKDIYLKKRHSLPGANGRQGSPRIQLSTSRTQPGTKENGRLRERKWQR
ncbi:Protein IQ-DOMAIN like [Actinidia chinensis var. chinensis]|uniref:Protein IQ-DOMAIN like n=1 Tax=Actinidia chinensis var. chinensis TaxID=1590841 RepID=A0A2R6Q095_ACTCC|nr:Protein IQ-DOMAIN like [Actinidia chinensis var. chinensis]